MEPLHRDDLSPELLEAIEQRFPGVTIRCIGDLPGGVPPEVVELLEDLTRRHDESLYRGTCLDCGAQMPGFPDPPSSMANDWMPAEGWRWFTKHGNEDEITAWQCPECDAAENIDHSEDGD